MAAGKFGGFAWGLFGFEIILLLGCMMTIFVSLGKVRVTSAYPMAIACLIGTILVSAVFGIHVDARAVVGDNPTIEPWVNRTLMFRMLIITILSLLATLDVYRRDSRSWSLMIRSALFLAPVVFALAWVKFKGVPQIANAAGEPSPVRMIIILLAGLLFGILLSVGGHFLIRSFEIGFSDTKSKKTDEKPV